LNTRPVAVGGVVVMVLLVDTANVTLTTGGLFPPLIAFRAIAPVYEPAGGPTGLRLRPSGSG
jgi:hypothetical protein